MPAALQSVIMYVWVCMRVSAIETKSYYVVQFNKYKLGFCGMRMETKMENKKKCSNAKKNNKKFSIVVAPETEEIQKILAQSNAYGIRDSKTNNGSNSNLTANAAAIVIIIVISSRTKQSKLLCARKRKLERKRGSRSRSGSLLQYNYRKSCLLSVI